MSHWDLLYLLILIRSNKSNWTNFCTFLHLHPLIIKQDTNLLTGKTFLPMFEHDVWCSYDSPFPLIKSCLLFQCRVVRIPNRPVQGGMGYVTPPQTSLPSSGVFSHSEAVRSFSTVALRIMSVFSGPNKNFLHMVPITQPTKEPLRSVPPNNNKQSPVCKHY